MHGFEPDFYPKDGVCATCNPSCELCSGENGNFCERCVKGKLNTDKACINQCGIGYYGDFD